jgi:phosphoserine phosphatase
VVDVFDKLFLFIILSIMKKENGVIYTGFNGERHGEKNYPEELIREYIKDPREGLFVSDFDGCITHQDFGVQCFDSKLHNGAYWTWTEEEFSELLLPTKATGENKASYMQILKYALDPKKDIPEKIRVRSQHLLQLHGKLVSLYARIKNDSRAPLRAEFADKMQEYDKIVLSLEGFFAQFYGNSIFSRLRFFAGKAHTDAKKLSADTLSQGKTKFNKDLLDIYKYLRAEGAEGRIITTNFSSLVREAVNKTILNEIFKEDDVIATQMQGTRIYKKDPFRIDRLIKGEPVFGSRKAQLALQESIVKNRNLILAAGDSHRGDGPMLAAVLKQGGIAIIPVAENKDISKVISDFKEQISGYLGISEVSPDMLQRTWCLQTNNFVPAVSDS